MAGHRRDDVREEDVTGLKYFDKLAPLLARLHEVGCQRDKAGNRKLHYDQYFMLVVLFQRIWHKTGARLSNGLLTG
jgi:hypothetical protein